MASVRLYLLLFTILGCVANLAGQEIPPAATDLALGQWESHLPYSSGRYVTLSDNKVYIATEWAIAIYDKTDDSFQRLTKVEGLSDVGISVIEYNTFSDILIVAYSNSVIDLIKPDETITLFDIANFSGIIGDKEVYDIHVVDERFVYLAGNFGLTRLDIQNNTFPFTTLTDSPARMVTTLNNQIYLATEEGVFRINEDNAFPEDFNNWELLGEEFGFPLAYTSTAVVTWNDEIYCSVNDTLSRFDGTIRDTVRYLPGHRISYLTAHSERLIAGFYCEAECDGTVLYFSQSGDEEEAPDFLVDRPLYALEDEAGTVWFADLFREFRKHEAGTEGERFTLNSPYSNSIEEIQVWNDEVWVAAGGLRTNYSYLFNSDGVFTYRFGRWSVYNRFNRSEFEDLFDFIDVEIDPETGKVYLASFLDGLIVFDPALNGFERYDNTNSSLTNAVGDPERTRVSGLELDEEGNLWVANHSADEPISVWKTDGTWESIRPSGCGSETQLLRAEIDQNGFKWFIVTSNGAGLMVFDEGDPEDPSDDRCRLFSSANSELPSNRVNAIAVDLDGDVWVGTEQGVVVFECGAGVFDPICLGSLRIIPGEEFELGGYLLETENVRTIAVDGANRKWFGTENGIFVQSPDGEEEVAYFSTDNSPLFDNIINDIAIQPETGEVFIGTNKGLQIFRGQATEGGINNRNEVTVFPNPIRPDYDGPIAIKGLARDANVKITDITGQLIYETEALGGQAIWDGRDYNGRKASTGVYLVFATSTQRPENPDAVVAKILFVN